MSKNEKKSWLTQLSYISFQRIKKVTEYVVVHDVMRYTDVCRLQPALTATLQAAISWRDVQCPVAHAKTVAENWGSKQSFFVLILTTA